MIHSVIFIYNKGGYIKLVDTFDIYKMIEFFSSVGIKLGTPKFTTLTHDVHQLQNDWADSYQRRDHVQHETLFSLFIIEARKP